MIDLDGLEKLAKNATPGEWKQSHRAGRDGMYSTEVYDAAGETIATIAWYPKPIANGIATYREENAAFIAAANPSQIIELINALRDAQRDEVPVAYSYELAHSRLDHSGNYCNWQKHLTFDRPHVPPDSIRNLMPLYGMKSKSSEGEA